jgi:hypothetical protein
MMSNALNATMASLMLAAMLDAAGCGGVSTAHTPEGGTGGGTGGTGTQVDSGSTGQAPDTGTAPDVGSSPGGAGGSIGGADGGAGAAVDAAVTGDADAADDGNCAPRVITATWTLTNYADGKVGNCTTLNLGKWASLSITPDPLPVNPNFTPVWNPTWLLACDALTGSTAMAFRDTAGPNDPAPVWTHDPTLPPAGRYFARLIVNGGQSLIAADGVTEMKDQIPIVIPECGAVDLGRLDILVNTRCLPRVSSKWCPCTAMTRLYCPRCNPSCPIPPPPAGTHNPATCTNDVDCIATPQCGGDICDWSTGMTCKPAGVGMKGSDGWCATDTDCKCVTQGARCVGTYCSFTKASDAPPDAPACVVAVPPLCSP